ncbi:MAG: TMEM53 family protein [Sandaracinaceae bacterium]|nr:TMEM53 family protein [Sandaracinaceae bacterium]
MSAAARILLLGWHDATARHLRAVARLHEPLGHVVHPVLSDSGRALARRGGFAREGLVQARALAAAHAADPRALVVHSFSNAGFWTLAAMLEALEREHPAVLLAHRGTILDSAPGFPEHFGARFTARTAPMAFLPGLLARLGRTPRTKHPLLSPLLGGLFGLWHLSAPRQIAFMRRALRVVRDAHVPHEGPPRPLLAIWGDADELVEARYVEQFLARAEEAGVPVERLHLPGSQHVRHLVAHRAAYEGAVRAFVARVTA